MKKYTFLCQILFIVCLSLSSTSCDSNSSDDDGNNPTDYFVKARIDDELLEFTGFPNIALDKATSGNGNLLVGSASESTDSNFPSFSFQILDPSGIQEKTYNQSEFELIFRYSLSGSDLYHSQAGEVDNFQITITEITDNHLRGTFSGTITEAINGSETWVVTEGQFFTKRQLD